MTSFIDGTLTPETTIELTQKCIALQGIQAHRLSLLFDGSPPSKVPSIKLFTENKSRDSKKMKLSVEKIKKVLGFNSKKFCEEYEP